ncbi:glycoside hydrolase family 28 protein [Chitinophaga pendula]|uniref:glycoside hydrolase family 28 protein n=1 Tax=Chitinophaga TaxID=79328 RepID=UPI000BB03EC8|nr:MULTISPECIES: glycoside hydrolase family 28 protein [Chitinophaga]ASZ09680.1 glycoside hydrolase [Chitinophaga sp. MD30]UCJ07380.1 glycoside hydrolase family 28 protein [Chitinophaga pendula]
MKMKWLCFLLLGCCYAIQVAANDVNIKDYGAIGDGATLNTIAIRNAIQACVDGGGGKVIVPAGRYLTGTIALKSNITLQLEKDAVILGSTHIEDYENLDPFTDGLGVDVGWALIVAVDQQNIRITGQGTIDGQGTQLKAQHILTDTRPEAERWGRRPFLLRIVRCEHVEVTGVSLHFAAAWTSHYFQCKKVRIEKVQIRSYGVPHNDGIDIDGCQQVRISNCDIDSGDDALCFKTTSSTMACRDIIVNGMRLKSGHGAIKMGTESMAPFEQIRISDCYIYDTNNGGIKLLTVDGAHLRDVEISDITMVNVKTPMLFRLGARLNVFRKGRDTQQPVGSFENVVVRNVKAQAAANAQLMPPSGILITGIPGHRISGLTLQHIEIDLAGGGTAEHARQQVPEAIDKYPEVKTFGPLVPAYGIWARHVKGLRLEDITFRLAANDLRPALVCEDGTNIIVHKWQLPTTQGVEALIRLEQVDTAQVSHISASGKATTLVLAENSEKVRITNNKMTGVTNELLNKKK